MLSFSADEGNGMFEVSEASEDSDDAPPARKRRKLTLRKLLIFNNPILVFCAVFLPNHHAQI